MHQTVCTPPANKGAAPAVAAPVALRSGACTRPETPYTHAMHAKRCFEAAKAVQVLRQYVQVQIAFTSCCARIVAAWDTVDGKEMWQLDVLDPIKGRMSVPAHKVRQCSGLDGCCGCAAETADRASFSSHEAAGTASEGVTCL